MTGVGQQRERLRKDAASELDERERDAEERTAAHSITMDVAMAVSSVVMPVTVVGMMVVVHGGSILRTRHEALRRHPGL
jgi:hypothetical protein